MGRVSDDACVGDETLAALADGLLHREEVEALEQHLGSCPDCCAVLARAAGASKSRDSVEGIRANVPPAPVPGSSVGRYVIESAVGQGAMGTVYSAVDPDLGRRVAVKLLRAQALSDSARHRMRARLLREAQAMARLSHPEVITVYDVGSFGDQLFVAMEYIDGETLRRWRTARHRTVEETLAVYERAGSGLAAAHEAGLVHRDFKPDNVLVARDGRVRVTDFGLARRMDAGEGSAAMMSEEESVDGDAAVTITRSGALLGTPAYMAPEQLRGRPSDARSDVFSFCVSLYEALYGERPFGGPTVTSLCTAIERGVVRPPPITTRVPGWLRSVLLQGLRPSPEARFASMRALLDALRAAHAAWRRKMIAFRVVGSIAGVGLAMGLCSRALPLADRDNARGLVGVDERHGTPVVTDFRANHTSIPSSESPPPLSAVRIVESMPTVDADPATPRTRTAPRPVDARPIASRSSSAAREVTSPGKESRPLASPSARPLGHAADEPQVGSNGALIME